MLFISSCIFEFPSGKVSLLFLFIQKFIDLTFILSEFFHSIEDFCLAFWSCYSITFKTTILFSSKKSPASDHCCSQDNLFFFNSTALGILLHLFKYYIPYLLLLSTILLKSEWTYLCILHSLAYFQFWFVHVLSGHVLLTYLLVHKCCPHLYLIYWEIFTDYF